MGTYIRKKEMNLIKGLAQKDYDEKVLNAAEKELQYLLKCEEEKPLLKYGTVENVYSQLSKERQR